jgi:hypothetical protein
VIYQANLEFCDSYMLGEETMRVDDPRAPHKPDWMFSRDGEPHPALCPECGAKVDYFIGHVLPHPNRDYDISSTYDGYVILSKAAASLFRDAHLTADLFVPLPAKDWCWLNTWDLPRAEINIEKSGVRRDAVCPTCGKYTEVLFGLASDSPPSPLPLFVREPVPDSAVFCSDLEFGSGHGQSPALFFSREFGSRIKAGLASGFHLRPIGDPAKD